MDSRLDEVALSEWDAVMQGRSDRTWQPCPRGSIGRLVSSINARRRRRRAARLSLVLVAFIGVGLVVWSVTTRPTEYNHGGIVCSEVRRLAPGYLKGKLDEDTSRKIAIHLGLCPTCGPTMQKMRDSMHVSWIPCNDPRCQHGSGRLALTIPPNAIDRLLDPGDTSLALMTRDQRL